MERVKLTQIDIAPWQGMNGQTTYSIVGLGADGKVYTYIKMLMGWKQLSNKIVEKEEANYD